MIKRTKVPYNGGKKKRGASQLNKHASQCARHKESVKDANDVKASSDVKAFNKTLRLTELSLPLPLPLRARGRRQYNTNPTKPQTRPEFEPWKIQLPPHFVRYYINSTRHSAKAVSLTLSAGRGRKGRGKRAISKFAIMFISLL